MDQAVAQLDEVDDEVDLAVRDSVTRHSDHQKSPLPATRITVLPAVTTHRSSAPTIRVISVVGAPPG